MNNASPFRILIAALLLAVFAGAALPGVAFADNGEPPVTEEPAPPPEDGSEPAPEETAAEEPAAEETPVAEEALAADEGAVTESEAPASEEEAPAEESLPDLPEGTDLVVLDENGEPLPLGSQEAAELIEIIDPIWCPAGVTPGGAGCSGTFASLSDLVAGFVPTGNGVIWIEAGEDTGLTVEIDGGVSGNWETARNYTLTFKGGWNGTLGSTTTTPATPSEFNTQISIYGWNNDITMSDIVISGYGGFGPLVIYTTGKVTLTRVEVSGNTQDGATIDNSGGTKDVVISNSTFSNNAGGDGLVVETQGAITLSSVIAENNGTDPNTDPGAGALLGNVSAFAKDVLVTNSTFSNNNGVGLGVTSTGKITLTNVIASENEGSDGANLDNDDGIKDVVVSNSTFSDNGGSGNGKGLNVATRGLITITNITAIGNTEWGAVLDNCGYDSGGDDPGDDPSDDSCDFTVVKNVTLLGTNIFGDNVQGGLAVYSLGAININNLISNSNDGWGAILLNHKALTNQPVTLTKYSEFKFNGGGIDGGGGLQIISKGNVTLSNVTATNNSGGDGLHVDNQYGAGNVTITGTNTFSNNGGDGLVIGSNGVITANNLTAGGNNDSGAQLDNSGASTPKAVKLTGTNTFNGNQSGDGIRIVSTGAITVSNLSAHDNTGGDGTILDNLINPASQQNVIVTGASSYNGNSNWGLYLQTYGTVTLGNVTALNNGGDGLYIINYDGALPRNVTLGNLKTENNGLSGVSIESDGAIKVGSIQANDNGAYGAYIDSDEGVGAVTITGINSFSGNASNTGLQVLSAGAITLYTFTADGNGGDGVYLDNAVAPAANISLLTKVSNWCNSTSGNSGHGFFAVSNGTISASNLCSNSNGQFGVRLENYTASSAKAVTLSGTNSMEGNGNTGLAIISRGAVTINNITANLNGHAAGFHNVSEGEHGIFIDNYITTPDTAPQNVTFKGYVTVNENFTTGLFVRTYGTITASTITASGNGMYEDLSFSFGGYGADLQNNFGSLARPVTLSGTNEFDMNYSGGLSVATLGAIKANNLNAEGNNATGVYLDNIAAPNATITLTGSHSFKSNSGNGLEVLATKTITLGNLIASDNEENGVLLNNSFGGNLSPADVKVTGTNLFSENGYSGLVVLTYGGVTLNNLTAEDNGWQGGFSVTDPTQRGFGVLVDGCRADAFNDPNCNATISKGVTITGTNTFNGNAQTGLLVQALGLIKANALSAFQNQGAGVQLTNDYNQALPAGVTITGSNSFLDNDGQGLVVRSHRTITLANITANLNGDAGADLNTSCNPALPTCVANVVMTGTNTFNDNGDFGSGLGNGLNVSSVGSITINNLTANGNGDTGASLNNDSPSVGTPFIKLTGVNNFNQNKWNGLTFNSDGAVTITNLTADGNLLGDGVNGISDGAITITCGSMTNNGNIGLVLTSNFGSITLKGVFALGNDVDNTDLTATTVNIIRSC